MVPFSLSLHIPVPGKEALKALAFKHLTPPSWGAMAGLERFTCLASPAVLLFFLCFC